MKCRLPGLWSFFDEGRTCDALLVEVKQWNGREKRQLLRHLARTGNFSYVFNYVEQYHIQLSKLSDISLNGRLLDGAWLLYVGRPMPFLILCIENSDEHHHRRTLRSAATG